MDTIALGTILLLLLLCIPYLSIADVIYRPVELFSISCGSSTNFSTIDGRNWTPDLKFLSESYDSVAATALTPSVKQGPYASARVSHSYFTYSFPITTAGPKFLRLFFYSASYDQNFDRSKAYFSVKAGEFTLLQDFNASLNADADDDPGTLDILFREYCINLQDGQSFINITFIPSTLHVNSYAFINGIEIVSMPLYLYYTNPQIDSLELPLLVSPNTEYHIENNYALETMYRLNTNGRELPPSEDTGMLRTWDGDDKYLTSPSAPSVDFGKSTKLRFTEKDPNYTAPDEVYRTVRSMGTNATINMKFNLTWQFLVDSGFFYLLRLHFCVLKPQIERPGDLRFNIYIQDQLATDMADILLWTDKQRGVPVFKDYVVLIPGTQTKTNLSLKLHPNPQSLTKDAELNGIELFKINSIADVIYRPIELLSINCGSSTHFSTIDSRNWIGDMEFLSESYDSVAAAALTQTTIQGPYTYARLSYSQFMYSFTVSTGPKFLRLFFYSTSYGKNFDRSKAYFSVKAGPYTLLQDFSASLNADAADDPGSPDILFREYCINLHQGERLNVTFIPSSTDSYAFINGIELVSMPHYLYYTNPNIDIADWPQPVGQTTQNSINNDYALETTYRLRVGDAEIPASLDTGMLRYWDSDIKYVTSPSSLSTDIGPSAKPRFTEKTPNYTAPDQVYRSLRNMTTINMGNLTWQFIVDSGFTYLLRLHYCVFDPQIDKPGDLRFYIYIQDQLADILLWTRNQTGVPVVRDYTVSITGNWSRKNLSLKLYPHPESLIKDAQLNGIEVFKMNDVTGNLGGPNPDPPPRTTSVPPRRLKRIIDVAVGALSGVILLSFTVAFFLIKRGAVNNKSNKEDRTSRGNASLSLSTDLLRHFSVSEMRAATNNFDEAFVVGKGGFGKVYKGYINDGSTTVAIKRRKPDSRQGLNEFKNEIELLSQLDHPNIVSLIGYCYENNDMILVYKFMDRGTLRDHLYDTHNPSISWKQRLEICIGVARGLHHLHTGAKHAIIHRDIKSANILLDENWVAKVSDLGLSRNGPTDISITSVNTQVKGSIGYIDPEYYKRHLLTEKSDVYSFGVLLLEVLAGREPLLRWEEKPKISLVNWAKRCQEKGTLKEIVDIELKGQIAPLCLCKFVEVALSCLLEDGTQRPSMIDIVGMLEFLLKLQDGAVDGLIVSGGDCQHSKHFSSDYIQSTGLSVKSVGDCSHVSRESDSKISDHVFSVMNVFSEIRDPTGR